MARKESIIDRESLKALIADEEDLFKPLLRTLIEEVLEVEMSTSLQADKGERCEERLGYIVLKLCRPEPAQCHIPPESLLSGRDLLPE
jgi:hypothetical protein